MGEEASDYSASPSRLSAESGDIVTDLRRPLVVDELDTRIVTLGDCASIGGVAHRKATRISFGRSTQEGDQGGHGSYEARDCPHGDDSAADGF
jgi:hypothetical protein